MLNPPGLSGEPIKGYHILTHPRGASVVARFDEQGNAKAFRMWNERQTGSTLFIVYTHAINNI